MTLKKPVCLIVALALWLTCVTGPVISAAPSLAAGNHAQWIDRFADLPEYAVDFYHWLESSCVAGGALVDPTKGTRLGDSYVHQIHELKGSLKVDPSASSQQLQDLIMAAVDEDASTATNYAFEVYGAFDRDHPEVFWLGTESRCGMNLQYSLNRQTNVVSYDLDIFFYLKEGGFDIRLECYRDPAVIAAAIKQRDLDIQRILSDCPVSSTPAEQVRYLNRVLTQSNAYNASGSASDWASVDPNAWKCVSALSGSVGVKGPVCEGYARAFKVLCDRLGIPCVLTEGFAKNGQWETPELHMWNYVKIDGAWYAVDVTWNDPRVSGYEQVAASGRENERYLLIGSTTVVTTGLTFGQSHEVRNGVHTGGVQYVNGPLLSPVAYEYKSTDPSEPEPEVTEPELPVPDPDPVTPEPDPVEPTPKPGVPGDVDQPDPPKPDGNAPVEDVPENYLDISPYRADGVFKAPRKEGFVFAGWFSDEELTLPISVDALTGYAYAAFVPEDVLSIRCQLSDGTTAASGQADLRILTGVAVRCPQYVTFGLSWNDTACAASHRLEQVRCGDDLCDAAELFGQAAAYIVTCTVTDIPASRFDDPLTITPCWYTRDGTPVEGKSRTIRISDGL